MEANPGVVPYRRQAQVGRPPRPQRCFGDDAASCCLCCKPFRGMYGEVHVEYCSWRCWPFRGRRGLVIAAAEDERALWISFDPSCAEIECAFTFVVAENDAFVLSAVPERAARDRAIAYRRRRAEAAKLVPRLADPAMSATEVLVRPRRRRPPVPVGLELRRRSLRRERADTDGGQ